ncbi:hypothetical protein C8N47_11263 [Mangrovibacterium marinum]|uniref:Uncharacterized protein n=1 Tax=Mangrovibacterium marinum TaxID=1639118 RepID=A0A2T5C011_9BACT|nr:hypothetical protein C8N47_11263 [Mangrovibacterium marinum]
MPTFECISAHFMKTSVIAIYQFTTCLGRSTPLASLFTVRFAVGFSTLRTNDTSILAGLHFFHCSSSFKNSNNSLKSYDNSGKSYDNSLKSYNNSGKSYGNSGKSYGNSGPEYGKIHQSFFLVSGFMVFGGLAGGLVVRLVLLLVACCRRCV